MRAFRLLRQYWSQLALVAFVAALAYPAYQDWSKQRAKEVAEREKKAALDRIGTDASFAGAMLSNAHKACRRIGIQDLSTCSNYEGPLLQEKAPPMLAKMALDHRNAYLATCPKVYAKDYCEQLLIRAFQLSLSSPESKD